MTPTLLSALSAPGMEALGAAADAKARARFKVPARAIQTANVTPIWLDTVPAMSEDQAAAAYAQVLREIEEDDRRKGLL